MAVTFDERVIGDLFAKEIEPAEDRQAITKLNEENPPFSLRDFAAICRERFDRRVDYHTISLVN